jgi:hypothetical protein
MKSRDEGGGMKDLKGEGRTESRERRAGSGNEKPGSWERRAVSGEGECRQMLRPISLGAFELR